MTQAPEKTDIKATLTLHKKHDNMTLPRERTSAVIRARAFLLRLCAPAGDGFKRIPLEVREEARRILRHYPGNFDLGRPEAFDSEEAQKAAERDAEPWRAGGRG